MLYVQLFIRYIKGWVKLEEFHFSSENELPSCSMIIAFRDEEKSLPSLLQSLQSLNVSGLNLEILLIDDHSNDRSKEIIESHINDIPNLRIIQSKGEGKKFALNAGISQAQNEIIVCTDADVQFGPNWLKTILAMYTPKTKLVSGPVQLQGNTSFFHNWQELEFLGLIGIGAASIVEDRPNMCNGANISFRKDAFDEVGGYLDNQHLLSGDDEFLMHKIARKYGHGAVQFCKSKEAIVFTETKYSIKSFLSQRMRWSSKATHYKDKRVFWDLLIAYSASAFSLVHLMIGIFSLKFLMIFLAFTFCKAIIEYRYYRIVLPFFNKQSLLKFFAISEMIQVVYVTVIGLLGTFVKFEWKGRKQ